MVLTYLDSLIEALTVRDSAEVHRLLAHPLARVLPEAARHEAIALAEGRSDMMAAPLRVLQLRHQTAELLREPLPIADFVDSPAPAEVADAPRLTRSQQPARSRRPGRITQMELPLSA